MKPEALHAPLPVPEEVAFDNQVYLDGQIDAFRDRMDSMPDGDLVVEFGGKPFGDHHASRVFPGYDPDNKAAIIRGLHEECDSKIAMVVNARDILHPPEGRTLQGRIRGDSGLRYDDETIRMIAEAQETHDIPVEGVVLAVTPRQRSDENDGRIDAFATKLKEVTGIDMQTCYEVPGYPDPSCLEGDKLHEAFADNDTISDAGRSLVLVSPGGGSGKFGVALSEIEKKLAKGNPVGFAKFETFPIFGLPPDHPLNLAFIAATADLGNKLVDMGNGQTNYDKDCENFALLSELATRLPDASGYISSMESQLDFSVNVIESGITDENLVKAAAFREIGARLERYKREYLAGDEKLSTVQVAARMAGECVMHLAAPQLLIPTPRTPID